MRIMICMIVVVFLGSLAGCRCTRGDGSRLTQSHGICDCQVDDFCASRAPWVRTNAVLAPPVETIPAPLPAKLPDGKTKKL